MSAKGYERLSPRPIPDSITNRMRTLRNPLDASSKVAWIKITSAAGLTLTSNPDIDNIGTGASIHGGINSSANVGVQESGFSAGGLGGGSIGYKPRPIVESIEVKNGKHGLSKKATISIKCFTIQQLEVVTKHFMEPAFTIVIQWGWNDGTGGIISGAPANFASINKFNANQTRKINANCAYENFLGIITGGSVSIDNESFNLNVEATGVGELSMNLQVLNETVCEDGQNSTPTDDTWAGWVKGVYSNARNFVVNKWTSISNFWEVANLTNYDEEPFLNMYGSLPPELQTEAIKALKWNYRAFVGFNESALEKSGQLGIVGAIKSFFGMGPAGATIGGVNIGDEPLIDGERFIRFLELTLLLETIPYNLKEGIMLAGGGNISLRINTENVPISAHKHIFSTDKSKLLILNQHTPDFGLVENFTNANRNPASVYVFYYNKPVSGNPTTVHRKNTTYPAGASGVIDFPSVNNINSNGVSAGPHQWGYLHDLYINFDYAMSIIKKPGILAKDALLEMLNGMSSAVNNLWDFQVVESQDDNDNLILTVTDMNFNKFDSKVTFPQFYSSGANSIFKSFSLNVDIPAAMKNQIIAKRASVTGSGNKPKFNPHLPDIHPTLWGSILEDQLYTHIQTNITNPCDTTAAQPTTAQPTSNEELIQKNALEFIKKAGIFLKLRDPNLITNEKGDMIKLANRADLFVGTYADTAILDSIRAFDIGKVDAATGAKNIGPLLPVNINFTVLGVGGLEFGHSFKIGDTLTKFGPQTGIFQITEITHNVNGNSWETTVEAKFRPI